MVDEKKGEQERDRKMWHTFPSKGIRFPWEDCFLPLVKLISSLRRPNKGKWENSFSENVLFPNQTLSWI